MHEFICKISKHAVVRPSHLNSLEILACIFSPFYPDAIQLQTANVTRAITVLYACEHQGSNSDFFAFSSLADSVMETNHEEFLLYDDR